MLYAKPLGQRNCKETSSNDLVSVYRKTTSRTPAAAAAAAAVITTSEWEICTRWHALTHSHTQNRCTSACASAGAMLWRSLQYALSQSDAMTLTLSRAFRLQPAMCWCCWRMCGTKQNVGKRFAVVAIFRQRRHGRRETGRTVGCERGEQACSGQRARQAVGRERGAVGWQS